MLARQAVLLTLPSDGNRPHWSYHHTGTLTRFISFVSHSYENCRVCTQNSHSETPYCVPANVPSTHLGCWRRLFLPVRARCVLCDLCVKSFFLFPSAFNCQLSTFAS